MLPCKETDWRRNKKGYGEKYSRRFGHTLHHRLVYEQHYGPIPDDMCVCHHCDNPPCIEITHLFLGTNDDNIQDAVKKGRIAKGEKHGSAKLTEKEIKEIRASEYDFSMQELAKMYKVYPSTIFKILRRITWKDKDD